MVQFSDQGQRKGTALRAALQWGQEMDIADVPIRSGLTLMEIDLVAFGSVDGRFFLNYNGTV